MLGEWELRELWLWRVSTLIPKVLSIAGSDPSGGAGIQADMKTMSALGAYAMSIPTALTSQSTRGVSAVFPVPVSVVRSQIEVLLDDIVPDAVKVGMLGSGEVIRMVGEYLAELPNVVLDPVMVSTSGIPLLDDDGVSLMRSLSECVDLVTPNLAEAAVLLDSAVAQNVDESIAQALALHESGWKSVLLKGGHLDGLPTDVYVDSAGEHIFTAERVDTGNTHGTGCTLSSAIASLRAHEHGWHDAIAMAKVYMTGALRGADSLEVGTGSGPLHHFHAMWEVHAL